MLGTCRPIDYVELNMDIVENTYTSFRTIGKDERWLHQWIKEKPSRLGLGELAIERSELSPSTSQATAATRDAASSFVSSREYLLKPLEMVY